MAKKKKRKLTARKRRKKKPVRFPILMAWERPNPELPTLAEALAAKGGE